MLIETLSNRSAAHAQIPTSVWRRAPHALTRGIYLAPKRPPRMDDATRSRSVDLDTIVGVTSRETGPFERRVR